MDNSNGHAGMEPGAQGADAKLRGDGADGRGSDRAAVAAVEAGGSHRGVKKKTGPIAIPEAVRFWRFVSPCPNTGCWFWVGAYQRKGYGHIGRAGKGNGNVTATRLSYSIHYGDPGDKFVCHRCDNPTCVNPDHLFLGTNADNMRDCALKGRARGPGHIGSRHGNAKLTERDVLAIRASSLTGVALAARYGVSTSLISNIKRGHGWRHVA